MWPAASALRDYCCSRYKDLLPQNAFCQLKLHFISTSGINTATRVFLFNILMSYMEGCVSTEHSLVLFGMICLREKGQSQYCPFPWHLPLGHWQQWDWWGETHCGSWSVNYQPEGGRIHYVHAAVFKILPAHGVSQSREDPSLMSHSCLMSPLSR